MAIAFVLCLYFAFYTIRLSTYYYYDENGQAQFTRGTEAYESNKEKYSLIEGEITPELISEAMRVYHEVIAEYGDDYHVPPEISGKTLGPYSPVYTWVWRAFSDESGASLTIRDTTAEQALNFYQERLLTLERLLEKRYEKQPQVVDYAMSCFTLFLSSRLSSPITVLAVSIAVAIIPTIILLTGANGNVLNWIRFCLPSGGVLPSGAMLIELGSLRFLWLGDFVTWSPYVILIAAAAQIPIWFGLSVQSYNKHEVA